MSKSQKGESSGGVLREATAPVSDEVANELTSWCSCKQCTEIEEYKRCCKHDRDISMKLESSGVDCITEHQVFKSLCLDEDVLSTTGTGNNVDQKRTEMTNAEYCRISRRWFVKWIAGRTDSNKKLPCCVAKTIMSHFPCASLSWSWWLGNRIGTMVIINNEEYFKPMEDRCGSQKDVERLQNLANNLNLHCCVIENKSYKNIRNGLSSECEKVIDSDQYFVCVILSHGEENHSLVDKYNNRFKLNSITNAINEKIENKDIIKWVIVQACRGKNHTLENEDVLHIEDPGYQNFLITFCSVYGHYGYRYPDGGTPFIMDLCHSSYQTQSLEIMQVVTAMKLKMGQRRDGYEYMASTTTRLTKEVYLPLNASEKFIPKVYDRPARQGGLFVIVGDQNKFNEDIVALQQIAKLWGFEENNIKTPCLELTEETHRGNFKLTKTDLIDKIASYVKNSQAISCLVCAHISDTNGDGQFKLNYETDTFDLKEITTLFRGKYSPGLDEVGSPAHALRGKPKLFFVQSDAHGSGAVDYLPHHPDADVMITFSKGGLVDKQKGKRITAFYDALLHCVTHDEHRDHYDLFKIMTQVRKRMADQDQPVPWTQTQLRKEVCFDKPNSA